MTPIDDAIKLIRQQADAEYRFVLKAMDQGQPWGEVNAHRAGLVDALKIIEECLSKGGEA